MVIIEKNEEAIQKLFKLKGYKLQFDDRVSAFLSANMTSDELVETRNLNDLAQLMQVNKKIVNDLTIWDEAMEFLTEILQPLVKIHEDLNLEL